MNWGLRIVLSFVAFMIFILTMVFQALQEDVNLVADDYYEQEIQFQSQLDRIHNTRALAQPIALTVDRSRMQATFVFPGSTVLNGQYHFFRPSDNALDLKLAVKVDSTLTQTLSIGHLKPGFWRVQILWQDGTKEYFEEKILII